MHLRFIHIVMGTNNSFLCIVVIILHNMDMPIFVYRLPTDGHLGGFQLWDLMDEAALVIHEHISGHMVSIFLIL